MAIITTIITKTKENGDHKKIINKTLTSSSKRFKVIANKTIMIQIRLHLERIQFTLQKAFRQKRQMHKESEKKELEIVIITK